MPYYQSGLKLCYKIRFNDYDRDIVSQGSPPKSDVKYKITDLSLEYEIVTQPDLARHVVIKYKSMVLLYDRVIRDRKIPVNKSDMA